MNGLKVASFPDDQKKKKAFKNLESFPQLLIQLPKNKCHTEFHRKVIFVFKQTNKKMTFTFFKACREVEKKREVLCLSPSLRFPRAGLVVLLKENQVAWQLKYTVRQGLGDLLDVKLAKIKKVQSVFI